MTKGTGIIAVTTQRRANNNLSTPTCQRSQAKRIGPCDSVLVGEKLFQGVDRKKHGTCPIICISSSFHINRKKYVFNLENCHFKKQWISIFIHYKQIYPSKTLLYQYNRTTWNHGSFVIVLSQHQL